MAMFRRISLPVIFGTVLLFSYIDVSEAKRSSRTANIVNGTIVESGQYPFMVSVDLNRRHLCAGSIINQFYILTAAHCLQFYGKPNTYSILVGTVKLSEGGTRYNITSMKKHEDFDGIKYLNDIAILKVDEPISFDEFVKPVVLPAQNTTTPSSTRVNVIGWGFQESLGSETNDLMKVELIVYSDEACLALHEDSPINYLLPTPKNICAGVPEGRKSECRADSGGPVFTKEHQVGIVSWSVKPCGRFPYPGVYTEVSHYIDWIKKNTPVSGKPK